MLRQNLLFTLPTPPRYLGQSCTAPLPPSLFQKHPHFRNKRGGRGGTGPTELQQLLSSCNHMLLSSLVLFLRDVPELDLNVLTLARDNGAILV